MDENTINNNNIVSEEQDSTTNLLTEDSISVTLDYYDRYYDDVLSHLDNLETYQETIIDNQEIIITRCNDFGTFLGLIIIFIAFIFIYNFLRNMIIVK